MRRIGTLGLLSAIAACNGGARDVGRAALERSQSHGSRRVVTEATVRAPNSDAPRLVTLNASGRMAVPGVVGGSAPMPTGAMPPSGGYVMRAPRASTRGDVATMGGEERHGDGDGAMTASSATTPTRAPSAEGVAMAAPPSPAHHAAAGPRGRSFASATAGGGAGVDDRGAAPIAPGYDTDAIAAAPAPAAVAALPPGTRITVSVSGPSPVAVAPQDPQQVVRALTAASVGDADRRDNYLDYLSRHAGEAEELGIQMQRRVSFRVVDAESHPVDDATITLAGAGAPIVAHTHADGSWDFYPSVSAPSFAGAMVATAQVAGVTARASVNVDPRGDSQGPVVLRLPVVVQAPPPSLDLSFLIDVTGSMGDELAYVDHEVGNIVQRIEAQSPGVTVRVSATFYRDRMDDVQLQQIPFTTNVAGFAEAMRGVTASGGGDYPEDMNAGLEAAMDRLAWSDGSAVRVMVLIADAPPQAYGDEQYTYHSAMADAVRRGIRILPVAASGADRSVEYLFRAMGAFTSTPYVYLTDDSGIGGAHMEADTDRVGVERFADLLTRLVTSDLRGQGMHEPGPLGPVG